MRRQYELTVRQEPKQARMCGIGGKADRRPIDPPVIVQLRVIDPALASSPASNTANKDTPADEDADTTDDAERDLPSYAQSFLQNPYYFMFASLAKPDDDTELHWLKDGRTRCTTGSVVSSLYALKDPGSVVSAGNLTTNPISGPNAVAGGKDGKDGGPTTAPPPSDAGFFVFPDLSVRTEGSYRLKLSLFEVVGNDVRHCKSIYSAPFYVYTAKKFPGVEESSPLTCSLADQGIKIRIRKDIRMRKGRHGGGAGGMMGMPIGGDMHARGGGLIGNGEPPNNANNSNNANSGGNANTNGGANGGLLPISASGLGGSGIAMPTVDPDPPIDEKNENPSRRPAKRMRTDDGMGNTGGAPPVGTPWPSTPLIPPPPGAEIQGPGGSVTIQSAPTQQQGMQQVIPPPAPMPSHDMGGYASAGNNSRYVPAPYDVGGHAPHQQQPHPGQQQQQQHPGQQQHQPHQQQHIPPPPLGPYRGDGMPPPPPPPHHGYPPPHQYQHPYYAYPPPPPPGPWGAPGPGPVYSDPYAHHGHGHQYAPPPPMRYDLNYAYPPHPGHHYPPAPGPGPYYDPGPQGQPQQGGPPGGGYEYAPPPQQQGYAPPPIQGQGQPGTPGVGGAPNPSVTPPGMAPPHSNPAAGAPNANSNMMNPNANPNTNPNAQQQRPPPPPQQYSYRPYAQPPPPPYYGHGYQHQPAPEAHAWGTPPSGFAPPPLPLPLPPPHPQQQGSWGEYVQPPPPPPQHQSQQQMQHQQQPVVPSNAAPISPVGGHGHGGGQILG
ncbi:velvet factor-domain-containing protein, partial [Mycena metata]